MEVTRALIRLKLASTAAPLLARSLRCLSTSSRSFDRNGGRDKKAVNPKNRFRRPDDANFFKDNGDLYTTQANVDFLLQHHIEFDNARATAIRRSQKLQMMVQGMRISLSWSPLHILNPYDIQYFGPRDHPLAAKTRFEYAKRKRDRPLWIWVLEKSAAPSIMRNLLARKLKSSVYTALENKGYGPAGKGLGGRGSIQGTLLITVYDALVASKADFTTFGSLVAEQLVQESGKAVGNHARRDDFEPRTRKKASREGHLSRETRRT